MVLELHFVQLNLYLKRLVNRIKQINILVEIDELLKTSQSIASSSVGPGSFLIMTKICSSLLFRLTLILLVEGVGKIFECYYYLACTERERKVFRAHCEAKTKMPERAKKTTLRRFSLPFAFFVASLALSRSRGKNNTGMFYLSLLDDYHGLSNRGVQVRAAYNTGLQRQVYTRIKKRALAQYQVRTEEALTQGLAVGVADNFNQKYWISRVDADKAALQNRNRCVGAVSILPQTLNVLAGNRNLQSMPALAQLQPFLTEALKQVENALEAAITPGTAASDWKFFDGAEVTQLQIHSVPLRMSRDEVTRRELPPHDIGLTHFRPLWILDADPASKPGSLRMFHKLFNAFWPAYEKGHYFAFRFDINIYNMFLRVQLSLLSLRRFQKHVPRPLSASLSLLRLTCMFIKIRSGRQRIT